MYVHLILSGKTKKHQHCQRNSSMFCQHQVWGINFDNILELQKHIGDLCSKASRKLHASPLMSTQAKRTPLNTF